MRENRLDTFREKTNNGELVKVIVDEIKVEGNQGTGGWLTTKKRVDVIRRH